MLLTPGLEVCGMESLDSPPSIEILLLVHVVTHFPLFEWGLLKNDPYYSYTDTVNWNKNGKVTRQMMMMKTDWITILCTRTESAPVLIACCGHVKSPCVGFSYKAESDLVQSSVCVWFPQRQVLIVI